MPDKFRTGDDPGSGVVFYQVEMPIADWFWAEVLDALVEMTDPNNWEQVGTMTVDDAVNYATEMCRLFMPSHTIGTIFAHASSQAPTNSLPCDGATHNRSDYPALYDALDAAYRVGSTQFTTPDLRGRTLIGDGQGAGLTNRAFAATPGTETVTLLQSQMPSHTHGDNGHSHGESQAVPAVGAAIAGVPIPSAVPGAGLTALSYALLTNTGGGGAHANMQPSLALHYAIWAK